MNKSSSKENPKIKIVEHPELRWWLNAITVKSHNVNNWLRKRNEKSS